MPISLLDVVNNFTAKKHQIKALQELESMMDPALKRDDSPWVQTWRNLPDPDYSTGVITPELMSRLTRFGPSSFDQFFCQDLNEALSMSGFDSDLDALRMLMANLLHESGEFQYLKEIDPGHYLEFRTDIGNTEKGDGPKFRGVTPLQVTGRYNYARAAAWMREWMGVDDPLIMEQGCDYVAEIYPFTFMVPWLLDNDLLNICKTEGFNACCYKINGGWNGKADRDHYYKICKREILSL